MLDNIETKLTENEKEAFLKGENDYEKAVICPECGGLGEAAEKGANTIFVSIMIRQQTMKSYTMRVGRALEKIESLDYRKF